jgi:hypothetical protein
VKVLIGRRISMLERWEDLACIIVGWTSRKNDIVALSRKVGRISIGEKKRGQSKKEQNETI